jgi:hypothetical protein
MSLAAMDARQIAPFSARYPGLIARSVSPATPRFGLPVRVACFRHDAIPASVPVQQAAHDYNKVERALGGAARLAL